MKPDGVATAALEPMETLESNPVNDAAGQDANQAASPVAEEGVPQPTIEETGEAKPDQAKETPAKTGNKTSGDPKAKTTNKAPSKTKPGTTAPSKTTTGSKPNTTQSRLSNGTNKLQTNGMAKKPAPAAVKKTTPTPAPAKKPTGTTPSPALKSKVGEKKPTGASPATNGAKSTTGTAAAKRTVPATTNGVKTSTAAAAAKKPPAPKTASATPTKPPVSKTTRPSVGTPASSRPATGSTRPPTSSTAKSSPATPKTTTPKTSSTTTAKPAASKLTTSTPSGGKPPASQTSRTTTPVKKDVTKPAASASKKPSDSPLTRPSATTKSAKPETPKSASKSDAVAKKPAASKDSKTPARPKAESKPTPAKTPGSKTSASKTPAPKKTVGSSTPTPVKRGPKAVSEPAPEKELAAAVAAAAAIASAAAVIAGPEVPEPAAAEEPQLMSSLAEVVQEKAPEPTPEPVRELTPEPVRELTPEPVRELTPEPEPEPESFKVRETSPEPLPEPLSDAELGAEPVHGAASVDQLSADLDRFKFSESAKDTSLGTTVMSPPSSPLGPVSPVRGPQSASSLLDMQVLSDPWDRNQDMAPSHLAPQSLVHTEEEKKDQFEVQQTREEEEEEEEENLFMPSPKAPSAGAQHHTDDFPSRDLLSPHEKEEAVEKADEEINEDDEEEDDEDEEQRRLGHQPSSLGTDMSTSQPSEEFAVRPSAFGGSAGWHGDDLLSGLDSEDVSSCTSSRQLGESDLSSTQHTALLEGTQSSDALVDSSLRGSEGDGNIMSSPNVETLANEEEDERVDDMDLSSERVEEHHKGFQQQQEEEEEEDEEDEDVEMHSEGVTESGGNVDEDDFNEEERLDNLNRSAAPPCTPPTSSWGQTNPFCDTWAQPAPGSSPSPLSDHVAEESETPVLSPAFLARSGPSLAPGSEEGKDSADEGAQGLFAGPAGGLCEPGAAPAARSNSETSTPEDLRDYDSSSGVESRSDKQQTPVPPHQADMEQDLGIHLEKGDGEEEEAETLPADEVLGTGPPTAPASAPSSPSTSGDEASDTEGEMQINDPDTPAMMDESSRFESPPPTCSLPALTEDEEAGETHAGEGEEDGGGTTPQSANSVASYGFDCTTSNSNAHSMAESCGKSPGIFSLENEEQLPEEAKDPSLIKELTLPSAAAVDLTPFGFPGDVQPGSLDEYMLGGKMPADHLEEVDPLEHRHHLGGAVESGDPGDSQPPYYSTICDKTDSVLAVGLEGLEKKKESKIVGKDLKK